MRFLFGRVILIAGFCALAFQTAFAQQLTVAKLQDFIKSAIELKNPDKDVAASLVRVKLTEKLTPGVVENLRAAGAGPKTMAALEALVTQSASLTAPAPKATVVAAKPAGPPPPSEEEKKQVLGEAREYALNYTKSLPDFLCVQVTRRNVDMHFQPGTEGSWTPADRLLEKLTFFDHKEKYEPLQRNDTALVGKTWQSFGGSISRGEFGSLLSQIFEPATNTRFRWLRWGTLRGNLTHVYEYQVAKENSQETIDYRREQQTTPGYHGLIYVQKGPNVVLRVTIHPDIPADFPVQDVDQTLDYDYQTISGQTFLLPLRSQVQMRDGHEGSRNEIEWRAYQKYGADTSISFDVADDKPLSDDQTKEQPAK